MEMGSLTLTGEQLLDQNSREELAMKTIVRELTIASGRIGSNKVRLIVMLVTLGLFILGAGAPEDGGTFIR